MRLWSISPTYLDKKGLVAVWREALLAKAVLEGKTKGYKQHPQLLRFKNCKNPVATINSYLLSIWKEAKMRGYSFEKTKIGSIKGAGKIFVSHGQLLFEFSWLLKKLKNRNLKEFFRLKKTKNVLQFPGFRVKKGHIEFWEKTKQSRIKKTKAVVL